MQLESRGEIYFTLQQSELISSVIVANGAVIARGPSLQERAPENWISALREMAEKVGKEKSKNYIPPLSAEAEFSLYGANEMVGSDFFIPPSPRQQLGTTKQATMSVLSAKRMKKLDNMFTGLRECPVSALEHHNQQVDALYNGSRCTSCPNSSIMQFAGVLSRLGALSDTIGNIYGLLSWQIFKTEEDRLVHEEGMSPNFAAKQMNQQMTEVLQRRCKAKDWASDGRRAGAMIFGPLRKASICVKSFALILLAGKFSSAHRQASRYCSLDSLLKIAHFPVLRKRFEEKFKEFVQLRTPEWELLEASGYRVFGYEEFLRLRGPPVRFGQCDYQILDRLLDCSTPLLSSPTDPVLSLGAGPEDWSPRINDMQTTAQQAPCATPEGFDHELYVSATPRF